MGLVFGLRGRGWRGHIIIYWGERLACQDVEIVLHAVLGIKLRSIEIIPGNRR